MRQIILVASGIAISLLILINLRRISLLRSGDNTELYTSIFAGAFIIIGLVLGRFFLTRSSKGENVQPVDPGEALDKSGISQREYEVLKLVAEGLSNQEISEALFISESTVKTHVSNLMTKLDAKRRTQAVSRAKEMGLL